MYRLINTILVCVLLSNSSCKKYLDEKSDKQLVIPGTVRDLQAILDYYPRVNNWGPSGAEVSADNYYLTYADWNSLSLDGYRSMYRWDPYFTVDNFPNDWGSTYDVVYMANTVLANLDKVRRNANDEMDWNNLKGQALFHRARSFHLLAVMWAPSYDAATATIDLGIPLRLDPDFNQPSVRASVQATYDQVIADLKQAVPLLPLASASVYRPSKPAAYALLSRVYLSMRNYNLALAYADSSLQLVNRLVDFNTLNAGAAYPVPEFNAEVIFKAAMLVPQPLNGSYAKMDSLLYQSYAANDLRKTIFFKNNNNGTYGFKGSYEGSSALFYGIATDEVYLTRAECYARQGNTAAAMNDLNALLIKRWKANLFVPYTASNSADALALVLAERRKELLMRGIRWMDIKRLNKEGAGIILQRKLNNDVVTLSPNDPRYALSIPENVISLSGIQQNPR